MIKNIELLHLRDLKYAPIFNSLREKKINFNKHLLLYEISYAKKDFFKIKSLIYKYITKSINAYYNLNLKTKNINIVKSKNLILNLPNITPNGVIIPKKENLQEYYNIQIFLTRLVEKYCISEIIERIELCDIRLMRSKSNNYDDLRSYSSSNIHSDNWSGNPADAKVALYIDGDKRNTIEFYKPKKIDKSFFEKKNNYKNAIKRYGFQSLKKLNTNKLTIFDQACLHRTNNTNCDIRLSIDFGIILKNLNQKKSIISRYKHRFLKKDERLTKIKLKKIFNPQSIHDKFI